MSYRYRATFKKRHTFLAVVHAETEVQALKNVEIAEDNGANGAFLINHSITPAQLLKIYKAARSNFPGFWLGVNLLGLNPINSINLIPELKCGLWVDNAGINEVGSVEAQGFADFRSQHTWKGLYFGGVAFKYQPTTSDPAKLAKLAVPFVDVVTTSGSATGLPPMKKKIQLMRQAIGNHPLAIASGITPENVHEYTDYVDCFLVATGVSDSHTELNPLRVRKLAHALPQ